MTQSFAEKLNSYLPEGLAVVDVFQEGKSYEIWVKNLLTGKKFRSLWEFNEARAVSPSWIQLMAHIIKEEVRSK